MKKLFLFSLLFLVSISLQAQTTFLSNFYLEDGSVVYRKVFDTEAEQATFLRQLMTTTGIDDPEIKGDMILAKVDNMKVDYKKYGQSWASAPIVLNHGIFGNLLVEFKDNRYRVSISNMYFFDNYSLLAASQVNPENNKTTIEEFFVNSRKGEFRTGRNRLMVLHYMDKHFSEVLIAKETPAEDW